VKRIAKSERAELWDRCSGQKGWVNLTLRVWDSKGTRESFWFGYNKDQDRFAHNKYSQRLEEKPALLSWVLEVCRTCGVCK
jgi:hypothetical protein